MSALLDIANLDLASTPGQLPPHLTPPAQAAHSPIPTAQLARLIQGVHTEVLVQVFGDRIFVVITQLGRIGVMIQVNPPPSSLPSPLPLTSSSLFPTLPPIHPATTLLPLFGAPPDVHAALLHDLYAQQAGAIAWQGTEEGFPRRPVLLGIALKRAPGGEEAEGVTAAERECFGEVMGMVEECCRRVGLGRQDGF